MTESPLGIKLATRAPRQFAICEAVDDGRCAGCVGSGRAVTELSEFMADPFSPVWLACLDPVGLSGSLVFRFASGSFHGQIVRCQFGCLYTLMRRQLQPPPSGFDSWDDCWRAFGLPEEDLGLITTGSR